MDGAVNGEDNDSDSCKWDSEDELEIQNSTTTYCPSVVIPARERGSDQRATSCPSVAIPVQEGSSVLREDRNVNGEEGGNVIWDSKEISNSSTTYCPSVTIRSQRDSRVRTTSCSSVAIPTQEGSSGLGEAHAGPSCSKSKLIPHFVGMGFSEEMVAKAIEENGEENTEAVLEMLLTYTALEKSPPQHEGCPTDLCSSESREEIMDDEFSDTDGFLADQESINALPEKDKKLLLLVEMGFPTEEAASAVDRCGPDASLVELTDSIYAAQTAKASGAHLGELSHSSSDYDENDQSYSDDDEFLRDTAWSKAEIPIPKRIKLSEERIWKQRLNLHGRQKGYQKNIIDEGDRQSNICLPKDMIGFGVPDHSKPPWVRRTLPEAAIGPPYFYYENVALTPKGVWETISRFLYDIEPEFVDSKHFCAAARKRGYIHNLPIENRFPLKPLLPLTIHEALPMTKKWWPSWDPRRQLNCLQTCIASAKLTERIRTALTMSDDPPPVKVQQYVLNECRKWNLVWVGLHKVAPLEPDEIEMLLGFPRDHTRGGGISRTERFRSLGNSFQVNTVAYHLSVLKDIFPNGITVLSLFSGIGGAEVALHRLGIPLKTVVAVEISEINRNILRTWWEQTDQKGTLIDIADVQQLNGDRLEELISTFGGFDLVIGGSPCNNLTGSNRTSRDGLEGKDSALFYDYFRILDLVKCIMGKTT